jgi:hypothetical protein
MARMTPLIVGPRPASRTKLGGESVLPQSPPLAWFGSRADSISRLPKPGSDPERHAVASRRSRTEALALGEGAPERRQPWVGAQLRERRSPDRLLSSPPPTPANQLIGVPRTEAALAWVFSEQSVMPQGAPILMKNGVLEVDQVRIQARSASE